jgi:hypothetical protein
LLIVRGTLISDTPTTHSRIYGSGTPTFSANSQERAQTPEKRSAHVSPQSMLTNEEIPLCEHHTSEHNPAYEFDSGFWFWNRLDLIPQIGVVSNFGHSSAAAGISRFFTASS